MRDTRKSIGTLLLSLFLLVGLSACASPQADSVPDNPAVIEPGGSSNDAVSSEKQSASNFSGLSVITSAWINSSVPNVDQASKKLTEITQRYGGYVESISLSVGEPISYPYLLERTFEFSRTTPKTLSISLRIPATDFETSLQELRNIGKESYFSKSEFDVTADLENLNAQISSLTESLQILQELQLKATTVSDLLLAEEAIAERKATLEGLISQRDYQNSQIAMSTIAVTFTEETTSPSSFSFQEGLFAGWLMFLSSVQLAATLTGFISPWLLLVSLISAISVAVCLSVWVIRKQSKRIKQN